MMAAVSTTSRVYVILSIYTVSTLTGRRECADESGMITGSSVGTESLMNTRSVISSVLNAIVFRPSQNPAVRPTATQITTVHTDGEVFSLMSMTYL
ncbi:MAG: hypothetical protein LBK58_15185 [Prevotellaceae bacterium]|nr:hypothetical protein [Prevotellaceae bacterium]